MTLSALSVAASADPAEIAVARLVRAQREYEDQLDAAFAKAGELAGAIAAVRMELASATVGHQVFVSHAASQTSLTEARGHTVAAHKLLDRLRKHRGIDISAYGDVNKDDLMPMDPSQG